VIRLHALSIAIDGPRQLLASYHFGDEHQLEAFQMGLTEQLTERGWLLCISTSR
jgi:hypothetical protein